MMNFTTKNSDDNNLLDQQGFRKQILLECETMARYALTSGLHVEPALIQSLDTLLAEWGSHSSGLRVETAAPALDGPSPQATPDPPEKGMGAEIGLRLAQLHATFTTIVHPAQPGTILLMEKERKDHPFWSTFGPVPLVRELLTIALVSLFVMCGISTLNVINQTSMAMSWFALHGREAFVVQLFLISAATVGASFANLSHVKSYINSGRYDTRYDSDYWIRLVLGIAAGIILSEVLFDVVFGSPPPNSSPLSGPANAESPLPGLTRMTAAFLGGYAAAQVQTLLDNMSAAIGSMFGGSKQPVPARGSAGVRPPSPSALAPAAAPAAAPAPTATAPAIPAPAAGALGGDTPGQAGQPQPVAAGPG